MADGIETRRVGAVEVVTFARPEVMNAWDLAMRRRIVEVIAAAEADPEVGALVFTGAGARAFGAGQDLREEPIRDPEAVDAWVDEWEALFSALRGCAKPTVAALNGVAAGSSFQFALLADARIGHPGIRMGQPEIRSGVASSMGPWVIATMLGPLRAQDLVLSGRLLDAAECERLGLVNRLVPAEELLPEAIRTAEGLAARPPLAMRLTKARLNELTEDTFRAAFPAWKRLLKATLAGNSSRP